MFDNRNMLFIVLIAICVAIVWILMTISSKRNTATVRIRDIAKEQATIEIDDTNTKKKSTAALFTKALRRNRQFNTFYETLSTELYSIGMEEQVGLFIVVWIALIIMALFITIFLEFPVYICGMASVACAVIPLFFLKIRKNKRRDVLESQLVDALGIICNAMKAGYSFQHSLNTISEEMSDPIAREFKTTFDETMYGMSMSDALKNMADRTGSKYVQMLEIAVTIQLMVGGNIITILSNLSDSIRIKLALEREIKAKTASIKLSGIMVGVIPIVLLFVMQFINPDYTTILFTTTFGNILLAVMIVLEIVGFFLINKMSKIKF